jgi:hypothetical protein
MPFLLPRASLCGSVAPGVGLSARDQAVAQGGAATDCSPDGGLARSVADQLAWAARARAAAGLVS